MTDDAVTIIAETRADTEADWALDGTYMLTRASD